ncbi:hypothetical protein Tco_0325330 [Tanacetum coccineum]
MKPTCSTCGSNEHLTKEHPELIAVQRTLTKLKAQSSQGSTRKVQKIPKPYIPCKYYGFNYHHSDECEYYHRYLRELGSKVVFGDNSSGDTKGYGSVNRNGITFT